jgi:hypothetical protein
MADFVCAKFEDITEPRTKAKIEEGLIGEPRPGNDAVLSPAERLEINLAKPRQNHRVLKLPCRRIAGAGKRHSARVFERERTSPAFGHDWTHDLTSFTRLQVAFRIPIECDDDIIGHRQCQADFKLSAEDLPVRRSGTTS